MVRDLPVLVEVSGALGQEVTAYVEAEAAWQVVTRDGGLEPALLVTDVVAAAGERLPSVVVVDGAPSPERARTALQDGALDVIAWPQDRHRLLEAPSRLRRGPAVTHGPAVFRVAGARGGVGTSTVALAIAAIVGWSGGRTVVAGDDDLLDLAGLEPWAGPGTPELAALEEPAAAAELGALARPLAGVDHVRLLGGGGVVGSVAGWDADLVVADVRCPRPPAPVDLLVARSDASLRAAARHAAPVVVVGERPLDRRGARRLLGRPPAGWLPHSARVTRAALAGRVPSALPGSWMGALREVLQAVRA